MISAVKKIGRMIRCRVRVEGVALIECSGKGLSEVMTLNRDLNEKIEPGT